LKTCNLLIDCIHVQLEYPFFRLQCQHSTASSFRQHLEFVPATMFALHLLISGTWCIFYLQLPPGFGQLCLCLRRSYRHTYSIEKGDICMSTLATTLSDHRSLETAPNFDGSALMLPWKYCDLSIRALDCSIRLLGVPTHNVRLFV